MAGRFAERPKKLVSRTFANPLTTSLKDRCNQPGTKAGADIKGCAVAYLAAGHWDDVLDEDAASGSPAMKRAA